MKNVVEYQIKHIPLETGYDDWGSETSMLLNEMANEGWIYRGTIDVGVAVGPTCRPPFHLFFKWCDSFIQYNRELLEYLKP